MKQTNMKIHYFLITLLALCLNSIPAKADEGAWKQAEALYEDGRFPEALQLYSQMAQEGKAAELYYNIGNCYFRMDSIPQALLWYERAYMLNPSDGDIHHNLQYARTKTIDKMLPEPEIFFTRWYRSLLNMLGVQGWTITGIVCFALCLAALCAFFFLSEVRWRKCGFYGAIALFVLVLLSNLFAYQQRDRQLHHERAIVFSTSVSGKSSPNKAGTELFLLHEGTVVTITDRSVRNWYEVRLPDGKRGWIPVSSVEVI